MSNMSQDQQVRQYLERQIQNASPAEQVVMLYDGAIRFLMQAKAAIAKGDIQARHNNNRRGAEIILYMMSILNHEQGGEVAVNLDRLYSYMLRRLSDVDMKNIDEPIDEVVGMLKSLRASWQTIAKGEVSPLSDAQPVVAGAEKAPEAQSATKKTQTLQQDEGETPARVSVSA